MPRIIDVRTGRLTICTAVMGTALLCYGCSQNLPPTPGQPAPPLVEAASTADATSTSEATSAAEATSTAGATSSADDVATRSVLLTAESRDAARETAEAAVDAPPAPNAAALPPPGPYLILRVARPSAASDLIVRHPDGALAATWRLPNGGRVGRLADALSPDGRWLAFMTGDAPDWHLTAPMTTPLTLRIWDLSAGHEAFATRLVRDDVYDDLRAQAAVIVARYASYGATVGTAASTPTPNPTDVAFTAEDVVDAFDTGLGKVAWSPDGRRVAFVAALDGPSGDVYAADVDTWSVQRLSDEPTHVIHLTWSPDSRWVLHEGTDYVARAAGYAYGTTTDSVDADGMERRHLWGGTQLGESGFDGAWFDGWIGDHEVVLHLEDNGCGLCQIVRIDVRTGVSETIASRVDGAGLAMEPGGHRLAVGATLDGAQSGGDSESGVFLFDLAAATRRTLSEGYCRVAYWGAADHPFARLPGGGLAPCAAAALGGDVADVPLEAVGKRPSAAVSPHGTWRVLYGDEGWRLYDAGSALRGSGPREDVRIVLWRPDDAGLFWVSGSHLWYRDVPDGESRYVGRVAVDPWDGGVDAGWLLR